MSINSKEKPHEEFVPLTGLREKILPFDQMMKVADHLNKVFPEIYNEFDKKWETRLIEKLHTMNPEDKEKFYAFMKRGEKILIEQGNTAMIRPKGGYADFANDSMMRVVIGMKPITMVREMILVFLISKFEEFLRSILELLYLKRPEMLKSTKTITFEEILEHNELKEVITDMIDKTTDEIISKDIEKIDQYLTENFKLNLSKFPDWDKFTECFYRRHIIVHNNSRPDSKYRRKTGYSGNNDVIVTDQEYIRNSLMLFVRFSNYLVDFFSEKFP